jgi:HEAT repeat protein
VSGLRRYARRSGAQSTPGQVVAALLAAAGDPVVKVRLRAVSALAYLPVEVGFPVAAAALEDDIRAVREAAGRAMLALDTARAGVWLAELCQDQDHVRRPQTRAAALTAIRMLPEIETQVWSALLDCLGDRNGVVRSAALSTARALATRPYHWHALVCQTALDGIASEDPYRREISLALARQVNAPGYQDRCRERRGDPDPMVSARAQHELTMQHHLRWRTKPTSAVRD